jgi:hypothetical protein
MAEILQDSDWDENPMPGIIQEMGRLGPNAIIFEVGLARLFGKHPISVKRAVARGELPPPARLMGKPCWTAGAIIRHVESKLEAAAKEAAILAQHRTGS